MEVQVRELRQDEFHRVEDEIWVHYHHQKIDPDADRIFGAFTDHRLVGVARVKEHRDGLEVDGVFVLEEFRHQGIARKLMDRLIREMGDETLWLHSTLELIGFYSTCGFRPVPEKKLPPTIRERFNFCMGSMDGCGICPMLRIPPDQTRV